MYLKIALFFQLLFFNFSSLNIKNNQSFIVEYFHNEDGKQDFNFLEIKLTKDKILEIDLEIIDKKMENKTIFIRPYSRRLIIGNNRIYFTMLSTNRLLMQIRDNNLVIKGKLQMKIEEENYVNEYLEGVFIYEKTDEDENNSKKVIICLLLNRLGPMFIYQTFHGVNVGEL